MNERLQKAENAIQRNPADTKVYLVGGGIASLASAVYCIRDAHVPGENICIFEESQQAGGSLDGPGRANSPERGYVIRGGRMFEEKAYSCLYELLAHIPALQNPDKSVKDEMDDFNARVKTHANARLVDRDGKIVDASDYGMSWKDKLDLVKLVTQSEESLGTRRINECFESSFFHTNFWYMWCTTFAFQPWHSAVELRRYLRRFAHQFPIMHTLSGVRRTPYNQYDSLVLPIVEWLKAHGVHFSMDCQVTNLDFLPFTNERTVERLRYLHEGKPEEIVVNVHRNDLVFVTNGSMTADSRYGSMTTAPDLTDLGTKHRGGSWTLWENIARDRPEFGRPAVFDEHVDESLWLSFTCTFRDPTFLQKEVAFTGNEPGTGALVTFKDSNWLMSIVVAYQPHFIGQPDNVKVCWGYGLLPNEVGNYVPKKMSECSGEEILTELCSHLHFTEETPRILKTSTCIPVMMPFITSQFLVRAPGDRPQVVPPGSTNLAFVSQFCEQPEDVVFTVEYSVRAAQTAVYRLFGIDKPIPPIYKGEYDLRVLLEDLAVMLR